MYTSQLLKYKKMLLLSREESKGGSSIASKLGSIAKAKCQDTLRIPSSLRATITVENLPDPFIILFGEFNVHSISILVQILDVFGTRDGDEVCENQRLRYIFGKVRSYHHPEPAPKPASIDQAYNPSLLQQP